MKLVQYVGEILPSEPAKILLPLCGKTPDLRWLYERGNEVVGIEGVEKLVSEFFEAHDDLTHTVEDCSFGKLYKTSDNRLKVYVCDVTKVPSDTLGPFDAVFDWGAFTAIHEDNRQKYVDIITGMLKPDYRYFVEVCHDGPSDMTSGPSNVTLRDLKLNFGPNRQLRFLETRDIAKEWGVDALFNSFVIVTASEKK
ncbi:thiopurine S-methyltransferase-like isoform X3 [Palaemon carinicauda]